MVGVGGRGGWWGWMVGVGARGGWSVAGLGARGGQALRHSPGNAGRIF